MKKKELSLYISEHEDDIKVIKKLQGDLENMEQVFPVFTPDLNWFEQNIEQAKKNSRRKLMRDLALFWIIALSIVMVTFMLVNHIPIIYLALQAIVLLIFIISNMYLHRRKRVEKS